MYGAYVLRRDAAGRLAGPGADLRARRLARGHRRTITAGTVVTLALLLTRLYGPLTALSNVRVDVMSALVSFERVFEVLDLAPGIAEAPDASTSRPAPARIEFRDVRSATRARPRCRWPRWRTWPSLDRTSHASRCCAASRSPSSRARWSRWSARPAPASRPPPCWCPGSTTSTDGAVRVGGVDVRDASLGIAARHDRRGHPGRAPVPRDDRGEPALRQARTRPTRSCGRRWSGRPDRRPGARACPTASTQSSASAATGSPAARSSASRSPGCC